MNCQADHPPRLFCFSYSGMSADYLFVAPS
jgi:hypothetical protein